MRKQIVSMLCGAVALAIAVPVFAATSEVSGLLRIQGTMENIQGTKSNKDRPTRKWVTQRFRPKWVVKVNDYLSLTYQGEVDTDWGVNSPMTAGNDGAQAADGVNFETKWIYTTVKVPGDANVIVQAGVQEIQDGIQSAYVRDDFGSIVGVGKVGNVTLIGGWAKLSEGQSNVAALTTGPLAGSTTDDLHLSNDVDVYALIAKVVPGEGYTAGAELYWAHVQGGVAGMRGYASDVYTLALTGSAKLNPVMLDGFLVFQNGTWGIDSAAEEDISAFGASVDAAMKFNDNLKGDLRVIYFGQDKSKTKDQSFNGNNGALFFAYSNMPIFLGNIYKTGQIGGYNDLLAYNEAIAKGYGLLAAVLNAEYNMAPYFVKGAVGYFQALTDKVDGAGRSRQGTNMGYEFCLQAGMKVADAATLSFRGSYAILGDFFDDMYYSNTVASGNAGTTNGVDSGNLYTTSIIFDLPF